MTSYILCTIAFFVMIVEDDLKRGKRLLELASIEAGRHLHDHMENVHEIFVSFCINKIGNLLCNSLFSAPNDNSQQVAFYKRLQHHLFRKKRNRRRFSNCPISPSDELGERAVE